MATPLTAEDTGGRLTCRWIVGPAQSDPDFHIETNDRRTASVRDCDGECLVARRWSTGLSETRHHLNGRVPAHLSNELHIKLVSVGTACSLPAQSYRKFPGRHLQSATGCFLSLDHESGKVNLLLFAAPTVIFALHETAESVSVCLTATAPMTLNWRL